jgi:hypothetical protein
MKKIILILVLILAVTSISVGQKVNFGPKIGYSASKLTTNFPDIKESVKHNFMAGLFLRIGKKLYFQPELLYHTRGGILDSAGLTQTVKFKNLEIPLMVGFKLLDLKVFNLRFMGGPVASFVLDKDITFNEIIQDPLQSSDLKDIIWGLDVGLGVDVLFLTLDVRYEFGLNNIYNSPSGDTSYDMKNNLFIVGLGFKLF